MNAVTVDSDSTFSLSQAGVEQDRADGNDEQRCQSREDERVGGELWQRESIPGHGQLVAMKEREINADRREM